MNDLRKYLALIAERGRLERLILDAKRDLDFEKIGKANIDLGRIENRIKEMERQAVG